MAFSDPFCGGGQDSEQLSSDKLAGDMWREHEASLRPSTEDPDALVVAALQKALDATTPESPGVPWEGEENKSVNRGWVIPGDDSEAV